MKLVGQELEKFELLHIFLSIIIDKFSGSGHGLST